MSGVEEDLAVEEDQEQLMEEPFAETLERREDYVEEAKAAAAEPADSVPEDD